MFRRLVFACIGSTLAIVALVWTTQAVSRINFATSSGGSITSFLHFMTLLIPQFIAAVLPFGIVIGCVQVLNTMNSDSEMPVLAGAGVGRWRIAKPVLLIALLAGGYTFVSNHFIEPVTNTASRNVLIESRTNLLTNLIQDGRFTEADENLVIFVDRKEGNNLERIMISDTRDPELALIYYAKTGSVGEIDGQSLLIMSDGQVHRKSPGSENITVIQFDSYAISLSQFTAVTGDQFFFIYERPTSFLLNPDQNDPAVKNAPGLVKAELHKRMTEWMYPVLMGLVALVLAGSPKSHRTGSILNYVLAFGAGLMYRGLATASINANKLVADQIFLLYLIPVAGILVSVWMFSTDRTLEMPQFVLAAYDRLTAKFKQIRLRFARRGIA